MCVIMILHAHDIVNNIHLPWAYNIILLMPIVLVDNALGLVESQLENGVCWCCGDDENEHG